MFFTGVIGSALVVAMILYNQGLQDAIPKKYIPLAPVPTQSALHLLPSLPTIPTQN